MCGGRERTQSRMERKKEISPLQRNGRKPNICCKRGSAKHGRQERLLLMTKRSDCSEDLDVIDDDSVI